jgi:hypothetical protein
MRFLGRATAEPCAEPASAAEHALCEGAWAKEAEEHEIGPWQSNIAAFPA